jgi:hypothetical protein
MPLPNAVRVKLSSEAAGAISITPVVVREMPIRELVEMILPSSGKDVARICRQIESGNLVAGASRLRWEGWTAEPGDVEAILASFPNPEPTIAFCLPRCTSLALCGPYTRIELTRESASKHRFLRRSSFWDQITDLTSLSPPVYRDYSYRDRADVFRIALDPGHTLGLRSAARRLPYSTLARQIESATLDYVELLVPRAPPTRATMRGDA